jgi:hypothetical protein
VNNLNRLKYFKKHFVIKVNGELAKLAIQGGYKVYRVLLPKKKAALLAAI